ALAIEPHRYSTQWEIARAWALEGRWDDCDRLIAALAKTREERGMQRLRFAKWRGDDTLAKNVVQIDTFDAEMAAAYRTAIVDNNWAASRGVLLARAYEASASTRRRTFICQIVAELASDDGDVETSNELIAHATDQGLFDLHWMDRCPMLAAARSTAAFAA